MDKFMGERREKYGKLKIMAREISPEKMKIYIQTAVDRKKKIARELEIRRDDAKALADVGAQLLRDRYGAGRVFLFGSLAGDGYFHHHSDIDLAVEGMDEGQYYRAVADLLALNPDFQFDLLLMEEIRSELKAIIESQGVEL